MDGRRVAVAAYDFTVMAGSMGMTGEIKVARLRELALTKRIPIVWLLDSAGARIQEAVGSLFAGTGHLFREEVVMSGVVPQVAALMGPCAAGTAYIPGLADFVPMVRGAARWRSRARTWCARRSARTSPRRSSAGARALPQVRRRRSRGARRRGVHRAHPAVPLVLPVALRGRAAGPARERPVDRMEDALLDVLPESNRKPYDMYDVIRLIVDDGSWFDLKPKWARTIITCFARMGGRPVGIVASQPRHLGGILDNDPPTRPRGS